MHQIPPRPPSTSARLCLALLVWCGIAGSAVAQGTKSAVIKPPAHVDPGMQVKPKPRAALPTPVIKPPANFVPK